MKLFNTTALTLTALMMPFAASAAVLSGIGNFEGNAGVGSSNGDVVDSPTGPSYVYVSTSGGSNAVDGLNVGNETDGSELTTYEFDATAGEVLSFNFNYVTSDGSGFADYSYVTLNDISGAGANDALLFNARTTPSGDTVPGFGLPDIDPGVTLNPVSTPISPNATNWSELGFDSGSCYAGGCGNTGWVAASFTIAATGTYSFTFGVVNWSDTAYDSGLAISGLTVGDDVIVDPNDPSVVPLPAAGWLLIAGLGGMGLMGRRKKQ